MLYKRNYYYYNIISYSLHFHRSHFHHCNPLILQDTITISSGIGGKQLYKQKPENLRRHLFSQPSLHTALFHMTNSKHRAKKCHNLLSLATTGYQLKHCTKHLEFFLITYQEEHFWLNYLLVK